jgi:type VI secretion system protein VasJ
MGANQVGLALPHLEQIINEIALYKLEEYDPLIAIKGLKLAWFAFDSRSDQESKGKAAEALQRIATLDLCEVIRLGKGEVKKNK